MAEGKAREARGETKHQVRVTTDGYLDRANDEINVHFYKEHLGGHAFRILDLSVGSVGGQSRKAFAALRQTMDDLYEYVGGILTTKAFRGYVRQQLKTEWHKRHKKCVKRGSNPKLAPPYGIDPQQYRRLVEYWQSPSGLSDSDKGEI
ncbi:unnamed protein product [Calypogeia fissa]